MTDEKDHLVSEALTEGSEAGALLLLLGKMLFLTYSAKGNPLGGLYIPLVYALPMQQAWEQAWINAQPALLSIRSSLSSSASPDPRIIRVGQLDSELLDQELVLLLQEPLDRALALMDVRGHWFMLLCVLIILYSPLSELDSSRSSHYSSI